MYSLNLMLYFRYTLNSISHALPLTHSEATVLEAVESIRENLERNSYDFFFSNSEENGIKCHVLQVNMTLLQRWEYRVTIIITHFVMNAKAYISSA